MLRVRDLLLIIGFLDMPVALLRPLAANIRIKYMSKITYC